MLISNLESIFKSLSGRYFDENDLSNFTYAFLNSAPEFLDFFLKIFAPRLSGKDFNVLREFKYKTINKGEKGRADLIFRSKGLDHDKEMSKTISLLVELKISDKSLNSEAFHIHKYEKAEITIENYAILCFNGVKFQKANKDWKILKLDEFLTLLLNKIKELKTDSEDYLIFKSYKAFLDNFTSPYFRDFYTRFRNEWNKCFNNDSKFFLNEKRKISGFDFPIISSQGIVIALNFLNQTEFWIMVWNNNVNAKKIHDIIINTIGKENIQVFFKSISGICFQFMGKQSSEEKSYRIQFGYNMGFSISERNEKSWDNAINWGIQNTIRFIDFLQKELNKINKSNEHIKKIRWLSDKYLITGQLNSSGQSRIKGQIHPLQRIP